LEHALSDVQIQKAKVEEAKAKDEALLLSIGDGLIATDKEGNIILANLAFERMMGWTEAEVIGKRMVDMIPHESEAGVRTPVEQRPLTRVLAGGTDGAVTLTREFYYIRKDGTRFPAAGTTTPILLNGEVVGAVVVFRDVTRERELDRAKTDFISLASHQLRTPLSSMKWVMELLIQERDTFTPSQKEKLDDLQISNQRLIQLVNSLLNIARMETGKMVATKKPIKLREQMELSRRLILPSAEKKRQTITFQFEEGVDVAFADPLLFDETFSNLLSNAINYGHEGSEIRVTATRHGSQNVIAINNQGIVIPPADRERLFTKFYRSEEARSMVSAGTGLGLYIVKAAVEANGGTVHVESSAQAGTTFSFTVPLSGS
jgi:PAS domain S-box-containing protein